MRDVRIALLEKHLEAELVDAQPNSLEGVLLSRARAA
mgnify:CR=1 FL=1